MDFVSDARFDGRRLRALTVVDAFTHEARAINVDEGIKGEQIVDAITRISSIGGVPQSIRVDNGPEFISNAREQCTRVGWLGDIVVGTRSSQTLQSTSGPIIDSMTTAGRSIQAVGGWV